MQKLLVVILCFAMLINLQAKSYTNKGKRVLIYTKNGEGYVHDNIPASIKALKEICELEKIALDVAKEQLESSFSIVSLIRFGVFGFIL